MQNNPQAAAEFLQCLGGDSFVFQTFDDSKNKNKMLSRVLIGSYEQHESALIDLNNRGAGIFVQANRGQDRGKDHITGIRALFVDLDDPSTAKESIETIQQFMPKPTAIVNSSKGKYHIYWKVLDCPVDTFKKMQVQLAMKFNADLAMGNLDRVMRLPGFIHQKGEPFCTTAVILGSVSTVSRLYEAASKAPTLTPVSTGTATKEVSRDKLKKDVFGLDLGSDYELPTATPVEGRNHALIKYVGHITGTGTRDIEEAQNMVRKINNKFDEPLPENELQATVFQSLARYIEDAKIADESKAQKAIANHSIPPAPVESIVPAAPGAVPAAPAEPVCVADQLLDRYIFSVEGQKVIDTQATGEYQVCAWPEFKALMKNAGTKKNDLSSQWLSDPERKTCRDVMWYPVDEEFIFDDIYQFYNLYRKPLVEPVTAEEFDISKLDIFFEHLTWLFPIKKDREFFLNWFAKTVTSPTVRIPWAPLLISEQGAGKGFIFQILAQLLGVENADNITMQSLESQFNPFMMKCSVLLIDEVSKPKQSAMNDKLKAYISEDRLKINRKGMQERTFPVYCNVIMFSNNDDAAHLQDGDRRYWVHKIKGVRDSVYYDHIFSWFKKETKTTKVIYTDNLKHLLRWCYERDLSHFKHNHKPPLTSSKIEMIYASRSDLEIDLQDAIDNREGPFGADIVSVPILKEYLSAKRDDPIKQSESRQISKILNKIASSQMVKNAITTIDDNIPGRHRVRCVRNAEYWSAQCLADQRREFTRSMQMYLKVQEVLPPVLELVEGESK